MPDINTIIWQCNQFSELSLDQLYKILYLRQQVFLLEQHCFYDDMDNRDPIAVHLTGWASSPTIQQELCAYLRIFSPSEDNEMVTLGRILCAKQYRALGLGKRLMHEAFECVAIEYPNTAIQISAQQYLISFYTTLGFKQTSDVYDEDGIAHIDMVKLPE